MSTPDASTQDASTPNAAETVTLPAADVRAVIDALDDVCQSQLHRHYGLTDLRLLVPARHHAAIERVVRALGGPWRGTAPP